MRGVSGCKLVVGVKGNFSTFFLTKKLRWKNRRKTENKTGNMYGMTIFDKIDSDLKNSKEGNKIQNKLFFLEAVLDHSKYL